MKTRCKKCGRFIGNGNLGGYESAKELRRYGKGYCERCILKLDELEMQGKGKDNGTTKRLRHTRQSIERQHQDNMPAVFSTAQKAK